MFPRWETYYAVPNRGDLDADCRERFESLRGFGVDQRGDGFAVTGIRVHKF